MATKKVARTARTNNRYADSAMGTLVDWNELEPGNPMGALELIIDGSTLPVYMPRNWCPDFDLEAGMSIACGWAQHVEQLPNGEVKLVKEGFWMVKTEA